MPGVHRAVTWAGHSAGSLNERRGDAMLNKTQKGRAELQPGQRQLAQRERALLLLADGRKPDADLFALFEGQGPTLAADLIARGYLVDEAPPPPRTPASTPPTTHRLRTWNIVLPLGPPQVPQPAAAERTEPSSTTITSKSSPASRLSNRASRPTGSSRTGTTTETDRAGGPSPGIGTGCAAPAATRRSWSRCSATVIALRPPAAASSSSPSRASPRGLTRNTRNGDPPSHTALPTRRKLVSATTGRPALPEVLARLEVTSEGISGGGHAAVDRQHRAGHSRGCRGAEPDDRLGHLGGFEQPADQMVHCELVG